MAIEARDDRLSLEADGARIFIERRDSVLAFVRKNPQLTPVVNAKSFDFASMNNGRAPPTRLSLGQAE